MRALIKDAPVLAPLPPEGAGPVVAIMFMMLFLGPIEELGWRGVMQPLLQCHMAPILNSARGSLLWSMLFHWPLINPFWPDAQPWDTWILVVVWWNRGAMFARGGAVTKVAPSIPAFGQDARAKSYYGQG